MSNTRLYIRGFPRDYSVEKLKGIFSSIGEIRKCYIVSKEETYHAVLIYYNKYHAHVAIEKFHGKHHEDILWFVSICEKKPFRRATLRNMYKNNLTKTMYLTGFPETWTDVNFKDVFGKYGNVRSVFTKEKRALVVFGQIKELQNALKNEKGLSADGKQIYMNKLFKKSVMLKMKAKKKELKQAKNPEAMVVEESS